MDEIDSIVKCFDVVKANKAHTIGYLDFDVRFILFFVPMNTDVCFVDEIFEPVFKPAGGAVH